MGRGVERAPAFLWGFVVRHELLAFMPAIRPAEGGGGSI
jgi:hypothetical protein